VSSTVYESGRTGLLLIDTVNEIFSEGGKGYPNFKEEGSCVHRGTGLASRQV
jgi:hypothetical protein